MPPLQQACAALALGAFVGSILSALLLVALTAALLVSAPTSALGWTLAALVVALTTIPLRERNGPLANAFMAYSCRAAKDYFPVTVIAEDEAAFKSDTPYVVGLEPHSALPTAMPSVFGTSSTMLPEGLRHRTHGLASSACFRVPLVRHVYWWNGIRPITRGWMRRLLHRNRCVVLVPGGVQECLYMRKDGELAFLSPRKGFVRIAMQSGAPLVPCFAFGQGSTYNWWRPEGAWVQRMSRRIGMVPMALVGRGGSWLPCRSRMTVVFGRPIEVPQHDAPPDELLQEYLDRFIADMRELFDKHKAAAGYPDWQLTIM